MNEKHLENMKLPKANYLEELETLSEQKILPLFDPNKFEFCSRDRRDKGIDLVFEIKKSGKHTGFRFIVQLKATESIKPNLDNSYSLSLNTSNINYLLNSSYPSFYVLYEKTSDTFLFESVQEFLKYLHHKNKDWSDSESHTLKFIKKLLPDGIELMYEECIKSGLLQRTIKEKSIVMSTSGKDKIIIDSDLSHVIGDHEIRKIIEYIGPDLINEGRWNEILALHKRATGNVASSAEYNLILGMANYYGGIRWEAISFFKQARIRISELNDELKAYLEYFDALAKYSIGILEEDQFKAKVAPLESQPPFNLQIKLEKLKDDFAKTIGDENEEDYKYYTKELEIITADANADNNIRLRARSELLLVKGIQKNSEYIRDVALLNAKEEHSIPDINQRITLTRKLIETNTKWRNEAIALLDEAYTQKNFFAFYAALANQVKIEHQFNVCVSYIYVVKDIPRIPRPIMPDKSEMQNEMIEKINRSLEFFKRIEHIENIIVTSLTLFEIFHYTEDYAKANELLNNMEELIDKYDLVEYRKKLDFLKNGGTIHQMLKGTIDRFITKPALEIDEYKDLREKMIEMDAKERIMNNIVTANDFVINLYPIGFFQFPNVEMDLVFEILNIKDVNIQNDFRQKFSRFIPVADIRYSTIETEGINQNNSSTNIESWRNIYRIRKAFYENKFYRWENVSV